jgi:hypothetical protein
MSANRKPTGDAVGFGTGDNRRRAAASVMCDHTPERATRQADGLSALLEVTELQERLHGELFDLYAGRAHWHHRQQEHARYLRSRLERWVP